MRPERRLKPGMDGGLRAAFLVRPLQPLQHPLRTPELVPIRRGSLPPGDRDDLGHLPIFKTKFKKGSRPRCGLLFIHFSGSRRVGNGNPISGSSLDWKMLCYGSSPGYCVAGFSPADAPPNTRLPSSNATVFAFTRLAPSLARDPLTVTTSPSFKEFLLQPW